MSFEFDWDEGNLDKIKERFFHEEIEAFFHQPLITFPDFKHSWHEERWIAIGRGPLGKPMLVCYTLRGEKIRPISARFMREKEARLYEKSEEKE